MLLMGGDIDGFFIIIKLIFGIVGGMSGFMFAYTISGKKPMGIIGFILGFLLFVPGVFIAVFICVITGNLRKDVKDSFNGNGGNKRYFDDISVPGDMSGNDYGTSRGTSDDALRGTPGDASRGTSGNAYGSPNGSSYEEQMAQKVEDAFDRIHREKAAGRRTYTQTTTTRTVTKTVTPRSGAGTDAPRTTTTTSTTYSTSGRNPSHDHQERRIYVEDLDKEVKNGTLSGTLSDNPSSDRLYNQYCGHEEDEYKRQMYKQADYESYIDSESADISPEAKKEYVESLKQKLNMGMISKEEYKKLIKRYR